MVQANPWFPITKAPKYDLGGPNLPYREYRGEHPWLETMKTVAGYGVDAMYIEMGTPAGCPALYRELLDEAGKLSEMKIAAFLVFNTRDFAKAKRDMLTVFRQIRPEFTTHPRVMKMKGKPLVAIYQTTAFSPDEWRELIAAFKAEIGDAVFLLGYSDIASKFGLDGYERRLRDYLEAFDGVTTYCYSMEALRVQRFEAEVLKKVMAEHPEKIFQGSCSQGYVQHFSTAGLEVHLSKNWRESVRLWLSSGVDSLELTNLFDHYENTLVYPCYEREDLLLRYLQYELSKVRGSEFRREREPELVLCNYVSALIGWTPLDFEVLGFPIEDAEKTVEVSVEVCDTAGKVLRTLGPRRMELNDFRSEEFSLKSSDFAAERGVVPRMVYRWKGKTRRSAFNPMTMICPSIRPYRLYWARSTRNAPKSGGGSGRLVREIVKRDGTEAAEVGKYKAPDPGAALHWHYTERIYEDGRREQGLPVWEIGKDGKKLVKLPVVIEDGSIREIEVESARIAAFDWPCATDDGRIVRDVSGWEHNALTDGGGYGGGHLPYTGYNLCHAGVPRDDEGKTDLFRRDRDGCGYLRMGGKNHITAFGGTAMPGACTYELEFRPKEIGRRMGLLSGRWGIVGLSIETNGCLVATRRSDQKRFDCDVEIRTAAKVRFGEWNRVSLVYDLRKLRVYLNGELAGEAPCRPNHKIMPYGEVANYDSHEFDNYLFIGAELKAPFTPVNGFVGYIRNIRVIGRSVR